MSTSLSLDNLPLIGMIIKYFRRLMFKRVLRKALKRSDNTITPQIMLQESSRMLIDQYNHPEKYLDHFIATGNYEGAVSALKVLGRDFTKKELRQLFKIYLNWGHGKLLTVVMRKLGKKRLSFFQYHRFFRGLFKGYNFTCRPVESFSKNSMLIVGCILLKLPAEKLSDIYLTKNLRYSYEQSMADMIALFLSFHLCIGIIDATEFHNIMERMAVPEINLFHYVSFIEKILGRTTDQFERELVFVHWLFNFEGPFHEVYRFAFEDLRRQLNVDDIQILVMKKWNSSIYRLASLIKEIGSFDALSLNQRKQFIKALLIHAKENGIKAEDLASVIRQY